MKYKSQKVAKLYFIAAIGLFVGQILFGLIMACSMWWGTSCSPKSLLT